MAKEKKKLMIPFNYGVDEMLSYTGFSYSEGQDNARKIFWDIEENNRANDWACKPRIKTGYYDDVDNPNYEKEIIEYNLKINEIQERKNSGRYIEVYDTIWKENYEFEDILIITGMSRGRSAANFNLQSTVNGKNYNLFMTDIVDLIQKATINKGEIKGKWTFVKRGNNYGIKLIEIIE